MCMVVVQDKEQSRKRGSPSTYRSEKGPITKSYLFSVTNTRHKVGRICGDIDNFQKHIDLVPSPKNSITCEVCGLN